MALQEHPIKIKTTRTRLLPSPISGTNKSVFQSPPAAAVVATTATATAVTRRSQLVSPLEHIRSNMSNSSSPAMMDSEGALSSPSPRRTSAHQLGCSSSSNNSRSLTTAAAAVPQIRHAGRAHVRGKIRRVWRPRFLELWDNGLVRYYELPAQADLLSRQTDAVHVNMIPKYTLAIFHARILDVTTFRDMHVGLPAACFGFVFRGQRLVHLEVDECADNNSQWQLYQSPSHQYPHHSYANHYTACASGGEPPVKEQRDILCAVASLEEAQMWVVALQWAASQTEKYALGPLTIIEPWWNKDGSTPRHVRGHSHTPLGCDDYDDDDLLVDDGMVVGIKQRVGNQVGKDYVTPKVIHRRAVSTPTTGDSVPLRPPTVVSTTGNTPAPPSSPHRNPEAVATSPNSPLSSARNQPQDATPQVSGTVTSPVPVAVKKITPAPTTATSGGKVVVSKVVQYRIVRLAPPATTTTATTTSSGHQFEIAYEIHVLLVSKQSQKHQHQSSPQQQQRSCYPQQQWSMLRTAADLQLLILELSKELGPTVVDQAVGGRQQRLAIAELPTLVSGGGGTTTTQPRNKQNSTSTTTTSNASRHRPEQWQASIKVVDTILRSLVLDATVVNSTTLKSFLGLTATNEVPLYWRCFARHDPRSVVARKSIAVEGDRNIDAFVKDWLQERKSQSIVDAYLAVWLQRLQQQPQQHDGFDLQSWLWWWWLVIPLASRYWAKLVPVVTIQLDHLILSLIGAAYLGSVYWKKNPTEPPSGKRPMSSSAAAKQQQQQQVFRTDRKNANNSSNLENTPSVTIGATIGESKELGSNVIVADDSDDRTEESDGDGTFQNGGNSTTIAEEIYENDEYFLSSPLPQYPSNDGHSCWSQPDSRIFHVRGANYLKDKVKILSAPPPMTCRGVDVWMTDSPERHIARHPAVLGGNLADQDTFLVNFLLPFGNLVAYFSIPPMEDTARFPLKLQNVWNKFARGDQEYRDARLKLLPVVVEGPWIVKAAVGPGKTPALLGKVIPLQYFFRDPDPTTGKKGVYEVDVIITASTIAKGILSVVKGHTNTVSIAFAFIIEGTNVEELPETVLCCFQLHRLHLENCPILPACVLDSPPDESD